MNLAFNNWREMITERRFLVATLIFLLVLALTVNFLSPRAVQKQPAAEHPTSLTPVTNLPKITSALPQNIPGPEANANGVPTEEWTRLPSSVTVYKVAAASLDPLYWPKRFGFAGEGRYLGLGEYLWSSGQRLFRLDTRDRSLTYQNLGGVQAGDLTLEQLQTKALTYLKEVLGKTENFTINRVSFQHGAGGVLTDVTHLEEANRVIFYLTPLINGLPLVTTEAISEPTTLALDRAGNTINLVHHFLDFELREPQTLPLKKPETAWREISEGKGKIVNIEGLGAGIPELNFTSLTEVTLAYLYPKAGETQLLPVLVFGGRAVDKNAGRSVEVTVLLWAVGEN